MEQEMKSNFCGLPAPNCKTSGQKGYEKFSSPLEKANQLTQMVTPITR